MQQEVRFCTTSDGIRIGYAKTGIGSPLVKSAHWISQLEFEWNSPICHPWLSKLSEHHTLIRYDKRGCGLSDWEVEDFSLRAQVRDLEAVVEAEGLEQFPLLGIFDGGPIALAYTVLHPEKVSHLILYGSYIHGKLQRATDPLDKKQAEVLLKSMEVGWGQDHPAFRQIFTSLFMPDATAEQMDWFNELQRISTTSENAMRMTSVAYSVDISDMATEVAVPALILHARGDKLVPFEAGRRLASQIPDARFVPLESENHILLKDEPAWDRFLAEARSFIGSSETETEADNPQKLFPELTPRECEVLDLIA